jgi:hypothetical protein
MSLFSVLRYFLYVTSTLSGVTAASHRLEDHLTWSPLQPFKLATLGASQPYFNPSPLLSKFDFIVTANRRTNKSKENLTKHLGYYWKRRCCFQPILFVLNSLIKWIYKSFTCAETRLCKSLQNSKVSKHDQLIKKTKN